MNCSKGTGDQELSVNELNKAAVTGVFHKTVLARDSEKASVCRIGQY